MLDLILQFVSLGCMAGCALSDKLCLEVFFGLYLSQSLSAVPAERSGKNRNG